MDNTPVTTNSGTFYDEGGASNDYGDYENYTKTFTPATVGNKLRFSFSSFAVETGYDYLYIYDGPNTSYPLIGSYTGSSSPGTITATNSAGAITFYFNSDLDNPCSIPTTGWQASISSISSCVPLTLLASPSSQTILAPSPAFFSVNASGTSPSYQWQYSTNGGITWNNVPNSSPYSGTTSSLLSINPTTAGMNGYLFRCQLSNGCTSSLTTSSASLCIEPIAPFPYVSSTTQTSLTVNWSSISGATSYYLEIATSASFGGTDVYSGLIGGTAYMETGLSCNTTYYYRVQSYNGACFGPVSSTYSTMTSPCCIMPTNPTPLPAAYITPTAFQARWTASGATGYYIDVAYDAAFSSMLPGYNNRYVGNVTSLSIVGLTYNATYYYKIKAVNSCGENYATLGTTAVTTNEYLPNNTYVIQAGYPSGFVAEPIDLATGSYGFKHSDFNLRTVGKNLEFTRYYNTVNSALNSALGYGWSHTYDCYVTNYSDTLWVVHYGDGHSSFFVPFNSGASASYRVFGGTFESLSKDITGHFSMTTKSGETFAFNGLGKLSSITDLNGNLTTLYYTGVNLDSIIAPGGRKLMFNYAGANIATIADQLGRSVRFAYDASGNLDTAVDADLLPTAFSYDPSLHLMQTITTANGNLLLANTYDGANRVVAQTDALHDTTRISYNVPNFGDATVINPDGSSQVVHHDQFSRLTHSMDELGHIDSFSYDYDNNLTFALNKNGVHSSFTFDTTGNCISLNQPLGALTQYAYNSFNKTTSIINALSQRDSLVYDSFGNLLAIYYADGSNRRFTYYSNGLLQTSTDRLSNVTSYFYSSFGDLDTVITPSGIRSFTYDLTGRKQTFTDENGHTTHYRYDNIGRLLCIKYPKGDSVQFNYDNDGNKVLFVDGNGNPTQYGYDIKDRLSNIRNSKGGNTRLAYDKRDNVDTIFDANNNSVLYAYDPASRLTRVINALGTIGVGYDPIGNIISDTDASGIPFVTSYDSLNRRIGKKDALNDSVRLACDPIGNTTSVTDPTGSTSSYFYTPSGLVNYIATPLTPTTNVTYDSNGRILSIKNPNNNTQYFRYDQSSRIKGYTDEDNHVDSFGHDNAGNLILHSKPTGTITKYYDDDNNLTKVVNSPGSTDTFGYDLNRNIVAIFNGAGSSQFSYDSLNSLSRYIDMYHDTVSYARDQMGYVKAIRYPSGLTVNYHYNAANLLDTVSWSGHIISYQYNPNGKLRQMNYPNGIACIYGYDAAGRLDTQITKKGATLIALSIFTLDGNGNRINEIRAGPYAKHLPETSSSYTYSNNNHIMTGPGVTFTFDNAGNEQIRTDSSGNTNFSFTVNNVLNSVSSPSFAASYTYNALGDRVTRTLGGRTTLYVLDYSGNLVQPLEERNSTGTVKAVNIFGLGLVARIDSTGNICYYHFDAQHNTVALTDDTGHVTDTYAYLPSGRVWKHNGASTQPFTFLGEYGVQQESGTLYYVRARYYDVSDNGVFITPDSHPSSLENPQTLDRYVYCLNNSIRLVDPSGLCTESKNQETLLSSIDPNDIAISIGDALKFVPNVFKQVGTTVGYINNYGFGSIIKLTSLWSAFKNDNYKMGENTEIALAQIAGGEIGSTVGKVAGASGGMEIGASIGVYFDGVGAIPGAIIGAIVGSLAGGYAGSEDGKDLIIEIKH